MEDSGCTRWSIALTAATAAAALLYCIFVYPPLHPGHTWYVPTDMVQLLQAGTSLVKGHLAMVYSGDRELYALPLSFPYAGVVNLLASWHNLEHRGTPWWLLIGEPLFIAPGFLALQQARRLAWELGVRHRLWLVQVVTAALVLFPEVEWGHVEDVMAVGFVLLAVRRLVSGRAVAACFWLSVAISAKQWAVMLVPLFVLAAPAGRRVRATVAACALPAVLASIFLLVDFHSAIAAFTSPVTQVNGFPGHPWINGNWLGAHSSQANRLAAVAAACLVAWRGRRVADPARMVATAGVVLLIRPLTETINYSYYWAPGLLLLSLVMLSSRHHRVRRGWMWAVAAMVWTFPRSNHLTALDWWAGEAVLLAVVAWLALRALSPLGGGTLEELMPLPGRPEPAEVAG